MALGSMQNVLTAFQPVNETPCASGQARCLSPRPDRQDALTRRCLWTSKETGVMW